MSKFREQKESRRVMARRGRGGGVEPMLVTMAIVAGCLVFSRNKNNRTVLQGNLADKVSDYDPKDVRLVGR